MPLYQFPTIHRVVRHEKTASFYLFYFWFAPTGPSVVVLPKVIQREHMHLDVSFLVSLSHHGLTAAKAGASCV
jgi:hypothetical protein